MASKIKVDQIQEQTLSGGISLQSNVTIPTGKTFTVTDGIAASTLSGALPAISGAALTALPATLPASSGVNLTALNATNLGSGTVPTARLGSGTADATTYLRGDQTYAEVAAGGITHASSWRINGNISPFSGEVDVSAVSVLDGYGQYETLGTLPTFSDPYFTLPVTGVWWIYFRVQGYNLTASTHNKYLGGGIGRSSNGGMGAASPQALSNASGNTNTYAQDGTSVSTFTLISTPATQRILFFIKSDSAVTTFSEDTVMTFIRLGDYS